MNIAPAVLPLFVYGTLLDAEFTANLLQHPVEQEPAVLHGYKVVDLHGLGYPVLVEADGERVRGQVYRNLSAEDYVRLDAYEGVGERLYQRASAKVVVGESTALESTALDSTVFDSTVLYSTVPGAVDGRNREWVFVYLPTGATLHRYG